MGQSWTKAHDASKNTFWENYPSIASPIIDTELNRNEVSVDTVDDRVITLDTTKAEQSDLLQAFKDVSLDSTTGVITFTLFNNTTKTIDTLLEKIAINFDYDDNPSSPHYQNLIIELEDGTYKYIDMSALITEYEFTDSSCISWTIGNDGSVTANIIDGSITGAKLQPNYLADCLSAKSGAESAEADAIAKALVSEGWAKGTQNGVPVTSGSPYYENNAEYFKDQASSIVGSKVDSFNGRTGVVLPASGDYSQDMISVPSGASVGQVPTAVSDGQGGLEFQMQTPANSGHTIVNPSGTDMTSRGKLQFTGKVVVSDDSVNDKTVVDILADHDFTISTTWVTNADTGDTTTYPYKQTISSALFNNNSCPDAIVLAGTPTDFMSSAELEDKAKLCQEVQYTTSGITLLATEQTTNALTLRVRGV